MLRQRIINIPHLIELKEQNTKFRSILRELGSEKFSLEGALKEAKKAFDLKDNDRIMTLDFEREQTILVTKNTIRVFDSNLSQYDTVNSVIKNNDYIIFNMYNRKVMIRTASIKEIMLVCDEMVIVLAEEA